MRKLLPVLAGAAIVAAGALVPFVFAGPPIVPVLARYSGGPVAGGGSIKGTVTVAALPTIADLAIGKDATTCGGAKKSPRFVGDAATLGLGNVVVYLDGIKKGKAVAKGVKAIVDQKGCRYTPHITIVPARGKVSFTSSDPILHNVHVYKATPDNPNDKTTTVLNLAMKDASVPAMPLGKRTMRKPGFYFVECDAGHIWMSAYIWVVEHPYYVVTDTKGGFELTDVPPGTYKLRFWHENWKAEPVLADGVVSDYEYAAPLTHEATVTVATGEAATVNWVVK
ncbi:MAG: hypothetical protein OER88_06005 [Planctomycetota bacterium]|nr:hypothetical protein [Planctomycetota bacterium]